MFLEDEDIIEIEKILSHRSNGDDLKYKIKLKGSDDIEWVSANYLKFYKEDLLDAYDKENNINNKGRNLMSTEDNNSANTSQRIEESKILEISGSLALNFIDLFGIKMEVALNNDEEENVLDNSMVLQNIQFGAAELMAQDEVTNQNNSLDTDSASIKSEIICPLKNIENDIVQLDLSDTESESTDLLEDHDNETLDAVDLDINPSVPPDQPIPSLISDVENGYINGDLLTSTDNNLNKKNITIGKLKKATKAIIETKTGEEQKTVKSLLLPTQLLNIHDPIDEIFFNLPIITKIVPSAPDPEIGQLLPLTPSLLFSIIDENNLKELHKYYDAEPGTVESILKKNPQLLVTAATHNRIAMVSALLQLGSNVDGKDWSGRTSLSVACENENETIIDLLINNGASINEQSHGENILLKKEMYRANRQHSQTQSSHNRTNQKLEPQPVFERSDVRILETTYRKPSQSVDPCPEHKHMPYNRVLYCEVTELKGPRLFYDEVTNLAQQLNSSNKESFDLVDIPNKLKAINDNRRLVIAFNPGSRYTTLLDLLGHAVNATFYLHVGRGRGYLHFHKDQQYGEIELSEKITYRIYGYQARQFTFAIRSEGLLAFGVDFLEPLQNKALVEPPPLEQFIYNPPRSVINHRVSFLRQSMNLTEIRNRLIFISTEYAIGDEDQPILLSVAALNYEGETLMNQLVCPRDHIKLYCADVHGISETHIRGEQDEKEALILIERMLRGRIIVAWDFHLEYQVLKIDLGRIAGIRDLQKSKAVAKAMEGESKCWKLDDVSQMLALGPQPQPHTSIFDAGLILEIYKYLETRWEDTPSWELCNLQDTEFQPQKRTRTRLQLADDNRREKKETELMKIKKTPTYTCIPSKVLPFTARYIQGVADSCTIPDHQALVPATSDIAASESKVSRNVQRRRKRQATEQLTLDITAGSDILGHLTLYATKLARPP